MLDQIPAKKILLKANCQKIPKKYLKKFVRKNFCQKRKLTSVNKIAENIRQKNLKNIRKNSIKKCVEEKNCQEKYKKNC